MTKIFALILLLACSLLFVQCKQEPISIEKSISNLSDFESADGQISIRIFGGKAPYSVAWSNNSSDTVVSNLIAGKYFVTITDAKNNTLTDTLEVTQPQWPICIDVDGNSYKTAIICGSTWMIENLKSTKTASNKEIESFIYENNHDYLKEYGRLYTWKTAMNDSIGEGSQGICPDGWHIPSDKEWKYFIDNISDMDQEIPDIKKALALAYAGFYNGEYHNLDLSVSFWTSTKASSNAYKRYFHKNLSKAFRYHEKTNNAISVRCVKN